MRRTRYALSTLLYAVATSGVAAGCGGDRPTTPDDASPPAFAIMAGSGQTGLAGQELPQPLVVRVTDVAGHRLPNVAVVYVVTGGGGSLFTTSVLTNVDGIARNYWTLGAPGAQTVEVRSVEPANGIKRVHGVFTATAQ